MKNTLILLFATLFLFGCVSNKTIKENPNFYLGGFDGVFVGDIQQLKGIGYPFIATGNYQMPIMLTIHDDTVSIDTGKQGGPLKALNLANLHIVKHKTNAIIYSQSSESDLYNEKDKGDWAETWNFTLTRKDSKTIYVYLVRAVNNFRLEPEIHTDESIARFFFSWSGELKQVASIERADQ